MPSLILIAHAPLASALKAVALHVFPDCGPMLTAIDVLPTDNFDDAVARVRRCMDARDTLILTDVFGATPCNVAMRAVEGTAGRVLSGLSVPMLWRVLCYAGEPLDKLIDKASDGAVQGVIRVVPPRVQNQKTGTRFDDQDHHPDQQ